MKLSKRPTILSFSLLLILSFVLQACSPKFVDADLHTNIENGGTGNTFEEISPSSRAFSVEKATYQVQPEKDLNGLSFILAPYLDPNNAFFIGDRNKEYLENTILNSDCFNEPVPVSDWEKIIRILFSFEKRDNLSINMYILSFADDGMIKRQYAIFGLMKLLAVRYSDLKLESSYENVKKSEIIADIDEISDKYQILIRQAYCLGFTDYTMDSTRLFRPEAPLNFGEAASILYRTLTNLGLPDSKSEKPVVEVNTAALLASPQKPSEEASEFLSLESIKQEYLTYFNSLQNQQGSKSKSKLNLLLQVENIIDVDFGNESINFPVSIEQWRQILHDAFGIEYERMVPYVPIDVSILSYDTAAVSIFKLSENYGGYETRDATQKELESARDNIPQFDTARDTSKFAQMLSSGLLDGLYQIPGFTPQRPVNKAELLLIVKRMTEDIPFN